MACGAELRTRFAPSPTGRLHLGHAFAALEAARLAAPGGFLLRIEDIDRERCRPEYEAGIFEDLEWLGLDWPRPVMRQSDRLPAYAAALAQLKALGVLYPCRCRRGDIRAALSAPQEGVPMAGPDGLIYPGTCRSRPMAEAGPQDVIRLDAARALALTGPLEFQELGPVRPGRHRMEMPQFLREIGDVILSRRGMGTSYHLAVVVDDAAQGIGLVTRGADLFAATWIHVLLQGLMGLPQPACYHHRLIRDTHGKRLAKRDDARALAALRAEGWTPADVRRALSLPGP